MLWSPDIKERLFMLLLYTEFRNARLRTRSVNRPSLLYDCQEGSETDKSALSTFFSVSLRGWCFPFPFTRSETSFRCYSPRGFLFCPLNAQISLSWPQTRQLKYWLCCNWRCSVLRASCSICLWGAVWMCPSCTELCTALGNLKLTRLHELQLHFWLRNRHS